MPSCVVKWCKNNSLSQKKGDGITFHSIPRNLDRREIWIEILRKSRNENNWLPSDHTLICSSHFEDRDLYVTTHGLCRIAKHAVPKKFLGSSFMACDNTSNTNGESRLHNTLGTEHATGNIVPILQNPNIEPIIDTSVKLSATNSSQVLYDVSKVKIEDTIEAETSAASQQVLASPTQECGNINDLSAEFYLCIEPIRKQPTRPLLPLQKHEARPIFDTSIKQRLINRLKKQQAHLNSYKKKIKVLNQAVRRLTSKNKSLEATLKGHNYLDTALYKTLNENIVPGDLFNILKRQKEKKLIIYTPSIKNFCLTLYNQSPMAYEYVRNTFNACLPHPRTLLKWYGQIVECETILGE